jgi:hypothetical protein
MSHLIIAGAGGGGGAGDFNTDAGIATPIAGVLNVIGGTNINTAGALNNLTINLNDAITLSTVNALTFDTRVATAKLTISGTSIVVGGTDVNADCFITTKGTGDLVLSNGGIDCTGLVTNSDIRSINGYVSGYNVSTLTNPNIAITLNENGIYGDGLNADVDVSITPKGTGAFSIDGLWGSTLESQYKTVQRAIDTNDATPVSIFSIPLAEKQMVTIKGLINGFKSTYNVALTGEVGFAVYRAPGGNVTIVGDTIVTYATSGVSTAKIYAEAFVGTQSADILVEGAAGEFWQWVTTVSYMYTQLP